MIILFLNNKGGVGKSSAAIETACAGEVLRGLNVLAIDLDSGTLTVDDYTFETGGSLLDWRRSRTAHSALCFKVQRPAPDQALSTDEILRLATAHDLVVIDGPIALSPTTLSAMVAADMILVPTKPLAFDLRATTNLFQPGRGPAGAPRRSLLDLVEARRAARGLPAPQVALLLNQVEPRQRELRMVLEAAEAEHVELVPAHLSRRVAYARAHEIGESVLTAPAALRDEAAVQEVTRLAEWALADVIRTNHICSEAA